MNTEALFIFLILLLGLLLCSFLGGNCKEGLISSGTVYNGPNGATATVTTNSNGTQSIELVDGSQNLILTQGSTSEAFTNPFGWSASISPSGQNIKFQPPNNGTPITFTQSTSSGSSSGTEVYNGPSGNTATVTTNSDGTQTIQLNTSSGNPIATFNQSGSTDTFTSSTGTTATISDGTIVFTEPSGSTITFYSSTSNTQPIPDVNDATNQQPNNGQPLTSTSTTTSNSSVLSSILGNFDNYNHYSGSGTTAQLQNGMVFTDSCGNNVTVNVTSNGTYNLQVASNNSSTPMILTSLPSTSGSSTPTTFKAPYGGITGNVITTSNGQLAIKINLPNGQTLIFNQPNSNNSSSSNLTNTQYYGSTGSYYQPPNSAYYYPPPPPPQYYPPQRYSYYGSHSNNSTYGNKYYSSLPQGIPGSQIPEGDEDLYILKSEVVPPVCPACPKSSACPSTKAKCAPCPACARCPEPSFECKKVPNYNAINDSYLPQPVLSDFSQFGM